MSIAITIPRLGWSMEEGTFGEWLKQPGEYVQAGDMVFLLEGEKAAHEIESFDSGILCVPQDAPQPGTIVRVGQVIGYLLAAGEEAPQSVGKGPDQRPAAATPARRSPAVGLPSAQPTSLASQPAIPRVAGPAARRLARQFGIDLNAVETPDPTGRVICEDVQRAARSFGASQRTTSRPISTPRARRQAKVLGIDWSTLQGTGRQGRIRECDVLRASTTLSSAGHSTEPVPIANGQHTPASKLRLTLARRMQAGVHQAAPVTISTKVDASALVAWRNELKRTSGSQPVPTYNDILLKLVAQTLRELPALNACWFQNGIWQYDDVHIAMGVDTEAGLLAPVVTHIDRLSMQEITAQTRQLAELARTGKLTQQQLEGGTFTVTNLGMYGVDAFTPILNLPQAGTLGIGRIVPEPSVRGGQIQVAEMLTLSLTFDHRVIDGAPAAKWLQKLAQWIADPMLVAAEPCETSVH